MKDRSEKQYCTLDHADKLGDLARLDAYLLRLKQVSRHEAAKPLPDERGPHHRRARREP